MNEQKWQNIWRIVAAVALALSAFATTLAGISLTTPVEDPVARGYNTSIYKEQGGNKMVVGSGGEIEFQDGSTLDVQGVGTSWRTNSISKTASYAVTTAETGALFSNEDTSSEITLTLPAAVEGLNYCIYVYEVYTLTLDVDDADQIHHLTNAVGDSLQNVGTAGDSICLKAINDVYWVPLGEIGTWSDAN